MHTDMYPQNSRLAYPHVPVIQPQFRCQWSDRLKQFASCIMTIDMLLSVFRKRLKTFLTIPLQRLYQSMWCICCILFEFTPYK